MKSSGKSTLMAALAKGRTDGTVTTIRVGDERIRRLSQVFTPRKTTFAEFRVREVAWPAASARKAQMERYLDQVAGAQVFIHVLRAFENPMLAESADAQRDLQMLDSEFVFAELSPAEQLDFAEAMGLPGTAADLISHAAFSQMGLISFFTVGEDEVRSWPIREGTRARQAAGAIHSDIERGFIRAEVVGYDTFMEAGSLKACRENGTLRIEGKDYQVADGNIINYRFNV